MGMVYGNAALTISADFSESATSGCYAPFSQDFLGSEILKIVILSKLSDGTESSLYFEYLPSTSTSEHLWRSLEATKLASRAWVCQERLLSSSIVHFTKYNLIWECQELIDVDDGISRTPLFMHPVPALRTAIDNTAMIATEDRELQSWYHRIISDSYSARQLTVASDKLPAIASLARYFYQYLGSRYVAGIWQAQIRFGLSWRSAFSDTASRPAKYRCPSWSWAAIDGKVQYNQYTMYLKPMITLENADIELDGQDPFGSVVKGSITVRGILNKFIVRERQGDLTKLFNSQEEELTAVTNMDVAGEASYLEVIGLILYLDEYQSPMYGNKPTSVDLLLLVPIRQSSLSATEASVRIGWAGMDLTTLKEQSLLEAAERTITIY